MAQTVPGTQNARIKSKQADRRLAAIPRGVCRLADFNRIRVEGEDSVKPMTFLRTAHLSIWGEALYPPRREIKDLICVIGSSRRTPFRAGFIRVFACAAFGASSLACAAGQDLASRADLPEAPQSQVPVPAPGAATLSGTVLDSNGGAVPDAHVQLFKVGTLEVLREVDSNSTGGFNFSGLAPGKYTLRVSANGMRPLQAKPVEVLPNQPVALPSIMLEVATTTTSIVVMDSTAASIEQEHIAEQQRVLGVFSNFYSSFDWNAPPMLTRQKYGLAVHTLTDPISFLIVGGIAGAEQYRNVFPAFGRGWQGYGKRYGAAFAGHVSGELFTRAIYPSIFHQDPRYFVMEKGATRARAVHAVGSTFVTRSDNGGHRINYSEILGAMSAGALAEAYYPSQERGVQVFLVNGLGSIGANAIDNLFREFVFNKVTRRTDNKHKP